jgi:pSer/pThr/pTyr-binding forkhead associated (FHA) protein
MRLKCTSLGYADSGVSKNNSFELTGNVKESRAHSNPVAGRNGPEAELSVVGSDKTYLIKGEVSIGRDISNDIAIFDSFVSRLQSRITIEGNSFVIHDLASSNGTYVNGTKIEKSGKVTLKDGDLIEIGQTKLKFKQSDS